MGLRCRLGTRTDTGTVPPAELHLRPRFLNDSLRFYGARPYTLSGNESLDLQRINAWVREASKGLLPSLLSALPPEPRLLLLSAVHLRGTALPSIHTIHPPSSGHPPGTGRGAEAALCGPRCPPPPSRGAVFPQPPGARRWTARRRCCCPSSGPGTPRAWCPP